MIMIFPETSNESFSYYNQHDEEQDMLVLPKNQFKRQVVYNLKTFIHKE